MEHKGKRLVKHAEAAHALGVEPCTVRKLTHQGRIPCVRIGRAVRYDLDEVLAFFKSQTQGGGK